MTEQETRKSKPNRDTSQLRIAGVNEEHARKALDDRCKAARRWIGDDEDACRGID
jgi:hypothetical protein